MTEVSYSLTRTINLGNYESVKVQVGLTLPIGMPKHTLDLVQTEAVYEHAKQFVDEKIAEEVEKWNE